MKVARSAAVAGCGGTSNVAAAMRYGLRPVGTMAHSYVMSFEHERDAYKAFMEDFPEGAVILVDTYDTLEGVRHAIAASRDTGVPLRACGWTRATCSSCRARPGGSSTTPG